MMIQWVSVAIAAGTLGTLAVAMSAVLVWANRAFHVYVDPRIDAINNVLPGANCGGCNYVGCNEYAEAVARGEASVDACTVGGQSCAADVAEVMGVNAEAGFVKKAVVHCGAKIQHRLKRTAYTGEKTCSAANLVAGYQGCVYGCLGFGDCVSSCDYDAIAIKDGLATIDYEACIGCEACTRSCPRNIISMVPFKADCMMVITCASQDFGKEVKEVCSVGCIGCKACERANPLFKMRGNLPILDYDAYEPAEADFEKALEKCPMESLMFRGRPLTPAEGGLADEGVERVHSEFDTTVDHAEWRG